jgi:hypothetical protein
LRAVAGAAAKSSFVDGLNSIILIGAIVAFAAALLTLVLIRQRDFVDVHHAGGDGEASAQQADQSPATVAAG